MEEKERLDVLLVKRGLAESREKARNMILAGEVWVAGQRAEKAGAKFPLSAALAVQPTGALRYVSRGGLKLEKAVEAHGIRLAGRICMDVGASTGGFTDCMLQNGAARVYAVDVGTDQLARRLREDERVVSMERTNIRYLKPEDIGGTVDFVSIDVAFISLTLVLGPVLALMKPGAELVALIKPQFEAGREKVGQKGVVRSPAVHEEIIGRIVQYAEQLGLIPLHLDFSPIRGPEGNIEYLLHAEKPAETGSGGGSLPGGCGADALPQPGSAAVRESIQTVVARARRALSETNR